MKISIGLVSTAALLTAAGTAIAVPRQYRGSDTLEKFTKDLITNCGNTGSYPSLASGELVYIGGGSGGGATAMASGTQDIAPMSRTLNAVAGEACKNSIPAGPSGEAAIPSLTPGSQVQQWIVALDGITVTTRPQNALRCNADTSDDPCFPNAASLAFNSLKGFTVTGPHTPTPVSYTFPDWRDVMRVLWAGADKTLAAVDGGGSNQVAANRITRCNSDIRRSLVADWDNMIQADSSLHGNDCGTVSFSCQNTPNIGSGGIRHLLRRDDVSGTTDTFLALLGLNSVGGALATSNLGINEPFCNGRDHEDKDPIRISCTTKNPSPPSATAGNGGPSAVDANLNDEVCQIAPDLTGGSSAPIANTSQFGSEILNGPDSWGLGLVNVISVPTLISTTGGIPSTSNTIGAAGDRREPTLDELYPTLNCLNGAFEFRRPPRQNIIPPLNPANNQPQLQASSVVCPDGLAPKVGNCLTPVFKSGDAELGNAHCVNARSNRPLGSAVAGADGRVWNKFVRAAPGTTFATATNQSPVLRNQFGRDLEMSYFRIRERTKTHSIASPVNPAQEFAYSTAQSCRELDGTRAIGCLGRAAECTAGYAGRESVDAAIPTQGVPLLVGNNPGPGLAPGQFGVGPNETAIRFLTDTANATNQYRLARKLYINSIVGFPVLGTTRLPTGAEASTPEALELSECLTSGTPADLGAVLSAITSAGFVERVKGSGAVTCEEFNESRCTATTLPDNDPSLTASCPP